MQTIGPPLERLTLRLAETPAEFLDEPRIGKGGRVAVAALVNDALRLLGGRASDHMLALFVSNDPRKDRNRLAASMIAVWLLGDEWFETAKPAPANVEAFLIRIIAELASLTPAHQFVLDPDRREELARTLLATLKFLPEGESEAQSQDRLTAISGTERQRLLSASRAAEERAREIREALAQKAAEESADKFTRE